MLRNIADRVLRRRDSTLQGAASSDGVAPQRHVLQNNRPMMEALEGRAMLTADVAGVWAGTRMGANGCIMSLQLVQKGTSVVGIEEIAITSNPQYYAEYNIIGTVSGDKFTFQDQSLISYVDAPGEVWLLPKYSVTVT